MKKNREISEVEKILKNTKVHALVPGEEREAFLEAYNQIVSTNEVGNLEIMMAAYELGRARGVKVERQRRKAV